MIYLVAKKIVLFLVEGITDKTALGFVLQSIIKRDNVQFELTDGDLTSEPTASTANIINRIVEKVKRFSGRIYKPKDFLEIVHLIDTDGDYVLYDKIVLEECQDPIYEINCIKTRHVEFIKRRNYNKSILLNKLIEVSKVWVSIPYSVYFFSCNLDHVLYNEANLTRAEKNKKSDEFEQKYYSQPEIFLELIRDETIIISESYNDSWTFIKIDTNSLKRYSNFNVFFGDSPKNQSIIRA